MDLKLSSAVLASKLARSILRRLGSGATAAPGLLSQSIDKDSLRKLAGESKGKMDFNDIKKILGKGNSKLVIVENNKPLFVVVPFAEYITGEKEDNLGEMEEDEEELTIDDLPLEWKSRTTNNKYTKS